MIPEYVDISHFRQPYKNAVFSGLGNGVDPNAAIVTADASGVKTLVPAAGLALMAGLLANMSFVVITTAGDKEQAMLTPLTVSLPVAATGWVNSQLAKGRSVIVSTNDPAGLAGLVGGVVAPGSQVVLAAVSTKADEVLAAGPSMPSAALITASKLAGPAPKPVLVPPMSMAKAGMGGPIAIAAIALLVVGGVYYAFGRKPKHRAAYDD